MEEQKELKELKFEHFTIEAMDAHDLYTNIPGAYTKEDTIIKIGGKTEIDFEVDLYRPLYNRGPNFLWACEEKLTRNETKYVNTTLISRYNTGHNETTIPEYLKQKVLLSHGLLSTFLVGYTTGDTGDTIFTDVTFVGPRAYVDKFQPSLTPGQVPLPVYCLPEYAEVEDMLLNMLHNHAVFTVDMTLRKYYVQKLKHVDTRVVTSVGYDSGETDHATQWLIDLGVQVAVSKAYLEKEKPVFSIEDSVGTMIPVYRHVSRIPDEYEYVRRLYNCVVLQGEFYYYSRTEYLHFEVSAAIHRYKAGE